jgi:DNA-binding response OmpR family regulator
MAKIIIAEDDKDIRELISFTLRYAGHHVMSFPNGEDAWKQILVEIPDLVILDVRMPIISGYEVCEKIKQEPTTAQIPVIFLSAKGQEGEIRTGFEVGAVDYLLKPFVPQALNQKVEEILKRKQEE